MNLVDEVNKDENSKICPCGVRDCTFDQEKSYPFVVGYLESALRMVIYHLSNMDEHGNNHTKDAKAVAHQTLATIKHWRMR